MIILNLEKELRRNMSAFPYRFCIIKDKKVMFFFLMDVYFCQTPLFLTLSYVDIISQSGNFR